MATINFLLQSKKNPASIYVRLRDGKEIDIKTKTSFIINPSDWDHQNQRPLKKLLKDIDYSNLETDLKIFKANLLKAYNRDKKKNEINTDWLKTFVNPKRKQQYPERLVDYIDVYIDFKKNDVAKATIVKCNVIKRLLIRFEKHSKSKLLIKDVNNHFKVQFEKFCNANGYAKNTTAKNIKYIKTFCKHAQSNGIEIHPQLASINPKNVKVTHIYLNEKEIKQIEKLEDSELSEALKNAKYWLLISCYCGQRVSDFLRFTKEMIRYEENSKGLKKPLLEFTQQKTGKLMTIPVHKKIIKILNIYGGDFPAKMSDQFYNRLIKKVCEKAKINELVEGSKVNQKTKRKETKKFPKYELVTSHIGRRSFATNNYGKIPTSHLRVVTGHASEATFLTYIGKSNKDIAMELTKYF